MHWFYDKGIFNTYLTFCFLTYFTVTSKNYALCTYISGSGTSSSERSATSRKSNVQPPPLPPPPAPEVLHHFPSPFQQTRNFHPVNARLMPGNAISDARLYNRSLMGHESPMPHAPPIPPTRGMASYNGVRTGSFASFGHPTHFGAPIQVTNDFSWSMWRKTEKNVSSDFCFWRCVDNYFSFISRWMDLVTPTILCLVCSFHTTPIRVALRPMIINYPTFPMAILRIITNQPPFAMAARLRQLLLLQMQPPVIVLLASSLGITLVEEVSSNSIDFNLTNDHFLQSWTKAMSNHI